MKNINFPAYYSKKESKKFYNLPTSCIKTFQKAVGCAGPAIFITIILPLREVLHLWVWEPPKLYSGTY
jgi:hypothetical protein